MVSSSPRMSWRSVLTTQHGHLALAMLAVELMAGMQIYLNQTVLPLMATDLAARDHYGLVAAAATVPAFLTMPLGGALLARIRADVLMTALTVLLIVGALVGAVSVNVWLYVLGEIIRGLAAGALATVTMGVLVAGLPDVWRRIFLAASSMMWIISSLVGPAYASMVSALWSWRWALVAYLPFLALARWVMSRQIRHISVESDDDVPPLAACLALASGVAVIGAVPASSAWMWLAAPAGFALVIWACIQVFPTGVVRLLPGRPSAIATLSWLCAFYFGFDYLIAPSAHDVLDLGAGAIGWALSAAGVSWSLVAAWCGAHPARVGNLYVVRVGIGSVAMVLGVLCVAGSVSGVLPWWTLHAGCAVAGAGMGLIHQDTVLRCVTDPRELGEVGDGISQSAAATSVTIAGNAGGATVGTFVTAFVAPSQAGVDSSRAVPVLVGIGLALALTPLSARRAR